MSPFIANRLVRSVTAQFPVSGMSRCRVQCETALMKLCKMETISVNF